MINAFNVLMDTTNTIFLSDYLTLNPILENNKFIRY